MGRAQQRARLVDREPAPDVVPRSLDLDQLRDVAHHELVAHRALQSVTQHGVHLLDAARGHAVSF
jgi:hypothetical protein